jgi:hypothetical protein
MTEVERLQEALINEKTAGILAYDDAYPDVGMGMLDSTARRLAIERLIEQGYLPQDYEGS